MIELHFGDQASLAGKNEAAQFAGSMAMYGTASKTRDQIRDLLQKLDATVSVSGGGGGGVAGGGRGGRGGGGGGGNIASATASISAPAANFEAALRLAVEIFKEPSYPADEFDRAKAARMKTLAEVPTEPSQMAPEALQRRLSPFSRGDALYSPTREEQLAELEKLSLDDVKKFHAQFYGASGGEFAILGPVDPAAAQKLAAELLGGWRSPGPYQRLIGSFKAVGPIDQKIETPDKANAEFEVGLRFRMTDADPDYPAMVLANYMFGGSITARMPDRIRNREGLSYSVRSSLTAPSEGDAALFSAMAIANPGNMPKVEAYFKEEFAKALQGGFSAEETAAAKKAYLDQLAVARAQDATLLSLLASHERLGRTMKWEDDLESKIKALTPAQISAAFKKYIDPAAVSIVKAGDFKAAGAFQQ
jgi:zinc protease